MISNVPAGTALIVYVADDGTIIDAVEPSGAPPKFASPQMDTLSGTKFVATGETAEMASAAELPTEQNAPAARSINTTATQKAAAACCYCQIMGHWYCRLSCC